VPVYVDMALAEDDTIVFPVGTYADTMSLEYADFARLVRPTVATFAYRSSPEE
jgi:prolyl-tRNA editing enzyme YbaK/EbsC (Cys-tRNA(Pro) deacylase)